LVRPCFGGQLAFAGTAAGLVVRSGCGRRISLLRCFFGFAPLPGRGDALLRCPDHARMLGLMFVGSAIIWSISRLRMRSGLFSIPIFVRTAWRG